MLTKEQIQTLSQISNSQSQFNDNKLTFETYGHHFNYNIAVTLANTYCIKGKPSMNTDAMYGVVRRYVDANGNKVCGYVRIVKLDYEECILATRRRDELEFDIPEHTYTFTKKDAADRGLLNQRAWKTMIKNMLHKRCLAALLRAFYPEIIGSTYSPDELAELMIDNENERDAIVFEAAAQERVPNTPAPVVAPSAPPAPVVAPSVTQVNPAPVVAPSVNYNPFPRTWESVEMTASEALMNIDLFHPKQLDNLVIEIKNYLLGVVFDPNPKQYVRVALEKLKIKEYQMTVDAIREFYSNEMDDVSEYLADEDPHDELSKNALSYIKMNVDQIKQSGDSFIQYLGSIEL